MTTQKIIGMGLLILGGMLAGNNKCTADTIFTVQMLAAVILAIAGIGLVLKG